MEDGEGGESVAVVYHSLSNSRQQHASRQADGEAKLDDVEEEASLARITAHSIASADKLCFLAWTRIQLCGVSDRWVHP